VASSYLRCHNQALGIPSNVSFAVLPGRLHAKLRECRELDQTTDGRRPTASRHYCRCFPLVGRTNERGHG